MARKTLNEIVRMTTITLIQRVIQPFFGFFEEEELKKFLRIGFLFTIILGSFWTLGSIKNALFCSYIGPSEIPVAKILSFVILFFLVLGYNHLLDLFNKKRMYYLLTTIFAASILGFAMLLWFGFLPKLSSYSGPNFVIRLLVYSWFILIDSYGSLIIPLFWAIASETTQPNSAKQGFYLITALGQVGGIIGPILITRVPGLLKLDTNALSLVICGLFILYSMQICRNFFKKTPKCLLQSYHGINQEKIEKKQKPGFFEGIRLIINNQYLLGILAVVFFFDVIVTIFDFHFHLMASSTYSGTALAEFQGLYGSAVNLITLLSLLLGIGNITKVLGVNIALLLMPCILSLAIFGFTSLDSLPFLFALMVSSKALNYAFNAPTIKQLYIPTTHNVRFKSQVWIEAFGIQGAKQTGSFFNMLLLPLQARFGQAIGRLYHISLSSYAGIVVICIWFVIAYYLGKKHQDAVKNKLVIC